MNHLNRLPARTRLAVALLSAAVLAACSGSTETPQPSRIELSQTAVTVVIGQPTAVSAIVRDRADAVMPTAPVTWISDNTAIAGVIGSGQSATISGYAAGQTIVRVSSGSATAQIVVTVAQPPTISLSATTATFAAQQNGATPAAQTINITNAGGGSLTNLGAVTTFQTGSAWLSVTLNSITAPTTLTIRPGTTNLAPGTYTATVNVSAPGAATVPIQVTYVVTAPAASIVLTTNTLNFTAQQNSALPTTQAVGVTSGSATPLTGIVGTIGYQSGTGWLGGTVSSSTSPATINVAPTTTALAPGTYVATISVAANATNSPQVITVNYTVTASGGGGGTCTASAQPFPFTVAGTLATGDCVDAQIGMALADVYGFATTTTPTGVRVTATTAGFFPRIALRTAAGTADFIVSGSTSAPSFNGRWLLPAGSYTATIGTTNAASAGAYTFGASSEGQEAVTCENTRLLGLAITTAQRLSNTDCRFDDAYWEDRYVIFSTRPCTITMSSTAFDAYLEVRDLAGNLLYDDDDSAGGPNGTDPRIVLNSCSAGGSPIVIAATSFESDQTGLYQLQITFPTTAALTAGDRDASAGVMTAVTAPAARGAKTRTKK